MPSLFILIVLGVSRFFNWSPCVLMILTQLLYSYVQCILLWFNYWFILEFNFIFLFCKNPSAVISLDIISMLLGKSPYSLKEKEIISLISILHGGKNVVKNFKL